MSDSMTIEPAQFAVVGQLTFELPNMPPDRLSAYGLSGADVKYLTSIMRAFRRIDDRYTQVRFDIVDTAPERHRRYLEPLYRFTAFWPYWVYFDLTAKPLY